jgi:hypothetical protein
MKHKHHQEKHRNFLYSPVNTEKIKCKVMSDHQNAVSQNLLIDNKNLET